MKLKFESPPTLRGKESQQLQSLHAYLYRLAEMLNMAFDRPDSGAVSAAAPQSPRGLFNSMKRLIASSSEIIDSSYAAILPRLQSIFLSISDFRQNSTKLDEKFSETEKKILDTETNLCSQIDTVRQSIPAIPQVTGENGWYILRHGDFVELWGSLSEAESTLPVSFESALAIPAGTVTGSTISLSTNFDTPTAVHIIGKEMQT